MQKKRNKIKIKIMSADKKDENKISLFIFIFDSVQNMWKKVIGKQGPEKKLCAMLREEDMLRKRRKGHAKREKSFTLTSVMSCRRFFLNP